MCAVCSTFVSCAHVSACSVYLTPPHPFRHPPWTSPRHWTPVKSGFIGGNRVEEGS